MMKQSLNYAYVYKFYVCVYIYIENEIEKRVT